MSPLIRKHPAERAAVAPMTLELREGDQWMLRPGPRQVGKTTTLGHIMQRLVDDGLRDQVLFAAADQPDLHEACNGRLDAIIEAGLSRHPATPDDPLYLFVDEIQDLPEWDQQLKAAWDRYHDRVRLVATGSNALALSGHMDFQGRIRMVSIHPMKFREVLEGHPAFPQNRANAWNRIIMLAKAARTALGTPDFGERAEHFHATLTAYPDLTSFVRSTFLDYCAWGGYPATRPGSPTTPFERLEWMDSAWSNILVKDLHHASRAKPREFTLLLRHIARNPGAKFVAAKVASDIGVKVDTVREWKALLEHLLLVHQLPPRKPNLAPHGGKDKAYPLDPAWHAYWTIQTTEHGADLPPATMGLLVESVLFDHLRRLQYNRAGTTALGHGYIANPEVDFAMDLGPNHVLVEAKFRPGGKTHLAEVGSPDDARIVATRDTFRKADIMEVPAHELALIC